MVSIFLTIATLFVVAGGWIWGSVSAQTNEPLFGEFHEDVVQLLFALAGTAGGIAFGMPWGLIPLPILAFLGLSLWLPTRLVSLFCLVDWLANVEKSLLQLTHLTLWDSSFGIFLSSSLLCMQLE